MGFIRVYNTELEPLGELDEIKSTIWNPKYWSIGSIKLIAPLTKNNIQLLQKGRILVKHYEEESAIGESEERWRRAAQITYLRLSRSDTGEEEIEAQGIFLSGWLSRRVIETQIITKDTTANIILRIVRENLGNLAEEKRKFPRFEILEAEELGGSEVEYANELLRAVDVEIKERAVAGKLGFDILVNEREQKYGFYLYKGKDLTEGNDEGHPPCIFSKEYENLQEQEYEISIENYKNVNYVAGQALEGEPIPVVVVGDGNGLDRMEVFTDASAIQRLENQNGQQIEINIQDYVKMLGSTGEVELANFHETANFNGEVNSTSNLKYRENYNLGDKVSLIDKTWGIRLDARITEVEEVEEGGKEEIRITFGEALPELIDKIRKVRR